MLRLLVKPESYGPKCNTQRSWFIVYSNNSAEADWVFKSEPGWKEGKFCHNKTSSSFKKLQKSKLILCVNAARGQAGGRKQEQARSATSNQCGKECWRVLHGRVTIWQRGRCRRWLCNPVWWTGVGSRGRWQWGLAEEWLRERGAFKGKWRNQWESDCRPWQLELDTSTYIHICMCVCGCICTYVFFCL